MASGKAPAPARPLTGPEMALCVVLMASGAVLVGWAWAAGQVYSVGFGILLVVLTPLKMLHIQGVPGPFDRLFVDDAE